VVDPPIDPDTADLVLLDEATAVAWVAQLTGRIVAGATIRSWAKRGHIQRYRDEAGVWYEAHEIAKYLGKRESD
jgi:hypothetical protein